jgi:DNA-binding FadR family transcriptional regulator
MLEDALAAAQESRYEAHRTSDMALHEMLLETVDNRLFFRMAAVMSDHSNRIRYLVEAISPSTKVMGIIDEHFELFEALRRRDPDLAHDRLLAHLEAGKQRTLEALEALRAEGS